MFVLENYLSLEINISPSENYSLPHCMRPLHLKFELINQDSAGKKKLNCPDVLAGKVLMSGNFSQRREHIKIFTTSHL